MKLDEIELAWAAGFFDGEGYVGIKCNKRVDDPLSFKYYYLHLNISQNDPEVLERFIKAVGYGTIDGPYNAKDKSLPMYYCRITKQNDVKIVMDKLYPYLCSKKQKQYDAAWKNCKQDAKNYNMLTVDQVKEIRKEYAGGNISMRVLGTKYNASTSGISDIVNYRRWKNV